MKQKTTLEQQYNLGSASALIRQGVEEGVFPGCALLVAKHGRVLLLDAAGSRQLASDDRPAQFAEIGTVYDVGGLTGSLVTATLIMRLVDSGRLLLTDKVLRFIQSFAVHGKSGIAMQELLSHTSGLAAWEPFFEELIELNATSRMGILTSKGAKDYIYTKIHRAELKYPRGERQLYSDLGLMVLGQIVELLYGSTLEKIFFHEICKPLALKSSSFIDLSLIKSRGLKAVTDMIAATEQCSWRKRMLCGEVQDDNAWVMGGVAGHAGLFTTAYDIHILLSELISAWHGKSGYLKQTTARQFLSTPMKDCSWVGGWDTPTIENGWSQPDKFTGFWGSNSFTGCSVWFSPTKELEIVFLTNRIHPTRNNKKIRAFLPSLFDTIIANVG